MLMFIKNSIFVLFYFLPLVLGFNLDVERPVHISNVVSDGSYFGYATAMAKTGSGIWVLIGAPRGNDTLLPNVERPGTVHRCQLDNNRNPNCIKMNIDSRVGDETVTYLGKTFQLKNGREDSWMGGTLIVGPATEFLTCAPKWYNIRIDKNATDYYMYGMCYLVPLDFNMDNVLKTPLPGRNVVKLQNVLLYDDAFGEVGLAAQFVLDSGDSHLQIGTPGKIDWVGGFADIHNNQVRRMNNTLQLKDITSSLIGSALSYGKYFKDGLIYTVVGSPRENLTGAVVLFPLKATEFEYQAPTLKLTGRDEQNMDLQINSYFGSSLCTVDVNQDGADDLLIGAPLYSALTNGSFNENIDIGMVSVHLGSTKSNNFTTPPQLLKGIVPYGRFGTSITSLGDINKDTFPDIAIGAPYENDYKGAVYIYNGYSGGLWPKYSQKIQPSDVGLAALGFGISIHSGEDLNEDTIPDVVIGSYLSDDVIVLFGKPIITLERSLIVQNASLLQTNSIKIGGDNQSVKICMKFADRSCTKIEIDVVTKLDFNQTLARLIFADTNNRKVVDKLELISGLNVCTPNHRFLSQLTNDYQSEIVIRSDYSVKEIDCSSYDVTPDINHFDGRNPMNDISILQDIVYFSIGSSELKLNAEAMYDDEHGHFVLGRQSLKINVEVTKTGDPVYGTFYDLVFPSFINYQKVTTVGEETVSCSILVEHNDTDMAMTEDEAALQCGLDNQFRDDGAVQFQIHLFVPRDVETSSINLRMRVTTINKEQDLSDNDKSIDISVQHVVDALFRGTEDKDTVFVSKQHGGPYQVTHVFELDNRGPSNIAKANLKIGYPQYVLDGKALMYLNTSEVQCVGTCEVKCSMRDSHSLTPAKNHQNTQIITLGRSNINNNDIKQMNCKEETCATLDCESKNIPAQTSLIVYLRLVIDNDIQKSLKEGSSLKFVSYGTVNLDKTNLISKKTEFMKQLETSIRYNEIGKKDMNWGIVIGAAIGGLVLLLIIILVLYKVGFFKRKKLEQLKEMRKSQALSMTNSQPSPKKKTDSFTDSEGGILDEEVPPAVDKPDNGQPTEKTE